MPIVKIVDLSLRNIVPTAEPIPLVARRQLIKYLELLGVSEIEIGSPALNSREAAIIARLLQDNYQANLRVWSRPLITDLKKVLAVGAKTVVISLASCSRARLQQLEECLTYLQSNYILEFKTAKFYLIVELQETARASQNQLQQLIKICQNKKVDRFSYHEAANPAAPFVLAKRISQLRSNLADAARDNSNDNYRLQLEVISSNRFATGTAAAWLAAQSGADVLGVSINSYNYNNSWGRAGLSELIMIAKYLNNSGVNIFTDNFKPIYLSDLAIYAARVFKQNLSANQPLVGSDIFKHESGIHAAGVLKNAETYEAFPPQVVGQQREIVLGKHSGTKAVIAKYKELGIQLTYPEAADRLVKIRKEAVKLKRSLTTAELLNLHSLDN